MSDARRYQPRCRTCGPLHPPCMLETALSVCNGHRINHPNHKTSWAKLPDKPHKTR